MGKENNYFPQGQAVALATGVRDVMVDNQKLMSTLGRLCGQPVSKVLMCRFLFDSFLCPWVCSLESIYVCNCWPIFLFISSMYIS